MTVISFQALKFFSDILFFIAIDEFVKIVGLFLIIVYPAAWRLGGSRG
jgi:hypothetical protein